MPGNRTELSKEELNLGRGSRKKRTSFFGDLKRIRIIESPEKEITKKRRIYKIPEI